MYNSNERGLGTMDLDEETKRLYYMLSPQGKARFDEKYRTEKKNAWAYYLLLIFLGGIGMHKFYVRQSEWGFAYVVATALSLFGNVFGVIFGLVRAGMFLYDLFTGVSQVRLCNEAYFRNTITIDRRPVPADDFIDAPDEEDEAEGSIQNVGL